jgi:hypothetical protein
MELIPAVGTHVARLFWEISRAAMKVEIHNKCSDIELVEPAYFSDGAVCDMPPDQKVDPGNILNTAFRIEFGQLDFEGALLCRLRKKRTNSDQQPDTDTTNINEKWKSYVQLLVAWKVERFHEPRVYTLLGEHGERIDWTNDELKKQYNEFRGRLNVHNGAVESTWLMEDGSALKLALDRTGDRVYGIKITIFEVQKDAHTSVPVWIEPRV